ncbi:MAG: C39 family peptidase [candidate division SR1 bacterium]|nr:C39 family peptidase [candidate division SR1 bacterium]
MKKQIIHDHFIYKQHPKKYPQQCDLTGCGFFTIKAVIESYHPELNKKPVEYSGSRLQRVLGLSTPKQLSKILNSYDIPNTIQKYHKKSMLSKIDFLKKHIENGPVIVLIAHAYTKKNMFNLFKAIFYQHYLSIRGYDDEKEVFYCYDSHTEIRENNLPVGNIQLHYQDLITYRDFAGLGLFKKKYIAIRKK